MRSYQHRTRIESGNFRFFKREDVTTVLLGCPTLAAAAVSKNISSCLLRICPSGKDPITFMRHLRWCQFCHRYHLRAHGRRSRRNAHLPIQFRYSYFSVKLSTDVDVSLLSMSSLELIKNRLKM